MNKRTLALALLLPGVVVAAEKAAEKKKNSTAKSWVKQLPATPLPSVPASAFTETTAHNQATPAGTSATNPNLYAVVVEATQPAQQQTPAEQQTTAAATTPSQAPTTTTAAPATTTTTTTNNSSDQQQQTIATASTDIPKLVPMVKMVKFSQAGAQYKPQDAFVPDQAMVGIGYDAVIAEVATFSPEKITDVKASDGLRDRTGKALRDIYYYLNSSMNTKQYAEAKKYIVKIQHLALTAQSKGILAADKRNNVVAWMKKYMDTIDALESERTKEINQLRVYDATNTAETKQEERAFDWHELAQSLGLEDDYEQAIRDFENLDKAEVANNRSHFVETANHLIAHLTLLASQSTMATSSNHFEQIERVISATTERSIVPGSVELSAAYAEAAQQKAKIRKSVRVLVHAALTTATKLSAEQRQIRAVATEHYSKQVVDALGKEDPINYNNLSISDLHTILTEKDDEGNE